MTPLPEPHELSHLPTWTQTRCAKCGEHALPNSGIVAGGGKPWQHITDAGCGANAARMATLPIEATLMHQALVEARQTLGRFLCEASDDEWTDDIAAAVLGAISSLDRGLDADKLVAFTAPEAA